MTAPAGKIRNPFLAWFLWPLITLGIYHLVWWYKINREARDFGNQVDPVRSVLAVSIGDIIVVPPFVSVYRTGQRIYRMQRAAGIPGTCNGWIGMVLLICFGLHVVYYQSELNHLWRRSEALTEGTEITLARSVDEVV